MKRILAFIFFLTGLYLAFQFAVNLMITGHNITYLKEIGNKEYSVNEIYTKGKNIDYYYLTIRTSDKEFVFDIDNTFNKQKNIVENIYLYEQNELTCLYPIFIGGKTTGELECNIDGELYSYFSIKDKYDLEEFINALPNYQKPLISDDARDEYFDLEVYKNNILDKETIVLYNYKNINIISKNKKRDSTFSLVDVPKNKDGILVDKYYILPDYRSLVTHDFIRVVDVLANDYTNVPLKNVLSSNYYINGVVDNILYIFDKSNMVQYSIDPKEKSYQIE